MESFARVFPLDWTTVEYVSAVVGLVIVVLCLLAFLLRRVPEIYRMTWDALYVSLTAIPDAWQSSEWLELAAQATQVLMLSVTMLGLAWFLLVLARNFAKLLVVLAEARPDVQFHLIEPLLKLLD